MLALFEKAHHLPFVPHFAPGAPAGIISNPGFNAQPGSTPWDTQGAFVLQGGQAVATTPYPYGLVQDISKTVGTLYRGYLRILELRGKLLLTTPSGDLEQRFTRYGYFEFDFLASAAGERLEIKLYQGQSAVLDFLDLRPI